MKKDVIQNIIEYAKTAPDFRSTMEIILKGIQKYTGFECVAIRIKNEIGDYPYYVYCGFRKEFIEKENSLCELDEKGNIKRDAEGNPVLECMCGNIIRGRVNPDLTFFTKGGSFWTNSTTELLSSSTEEDRKARTRNRCNGEGYESVGLFPLKYGVIILGLLQLNDHKKGMFKKELLEDYEKAAAQIAHFVYFSAIFKDFREK